MRLLRKFDYNAPVTLTFTLLAALILVISAFTGGAFMNLFVVYPVGQSDLLWPFRLFSWVLGHGSFSHFFGNFSLILLIGPVIEETFGSKRLLIMMAVTAFVGGLFHSLLFSGGLLGASGIVYMLILMLPFTSRKRGKIPLTFIFICLFYLGSEIISGLYSHDNVSHSAHILGGLMGAFMGYRMQKSLPASKPSEEENISLITPEETEAPATEISLTDSDVTEA